MHLAPGARREAVELFDQRDRGNGVATENAVPVI